MPAARPIPDVFRSAGAGAGIGLGVAEATAAAAGAAVVAAAPCRAAGVVAAAALAAALLGGCARPVDTGTADFRRSGELIALGGGDGGARHACVGCHGLHGEGNGLDAPRLAGLDAGYLQKQLQDYAQGLRRHALMEHVAGLLDPGQRVLVAAHYAALPVPRPAGGAPEAAPAAAGNAGVAAVPVPVRSRLAASAAVAAVVDTAGGDPRERGTGVGGDAAAIAGAGARVGVGVDAKPAGAARPDAAPVDARTLHVAGDAARGLPSCAGCHGADANGIGSANPALTGQSAAYLAEQLAAWRDGRRRNDPDDTMLRIAQRLRPHEIAPLTAYLAALPPAARPTPGPAAAPVAASPPASR